MAFADTYEGSYQGSASGTFTLHVDVIGGIQGSGPGVESISGQVNEFGQVTFSFPDGTAFLGQFSADHRSIAGTWKSPKGSGTFVAKSVTVTNDNGGAGNGGAGNGGAGNGGAGNGGKASSTPTASAVVEATKQACQKSVTCVLSTSCTEANNMTEPRWPKACWDEELAVSQCIIDSPCSDSSAACLTKTAEGLYCAATATLSRATGSYPNNPDFNPAPTGIGPFDRAVHLCSACTDEAKSCYASAACKAYATCLAACPEEDFDCEDSCGTTQPGGYMDYSDTAFCSYTNC